MTTVSTATTQSTDSNIINNKSTNNDGVVGDTIVNNSTEEQQQQQQHVPPRLYTLSEIQKAIGIVATNINTNTNEATSSFTSSSDSFNEQLMHSLRNGFIAYENNEFFACPIQTMGLPPYEFTCKKYDHDLRNTTATNQTCIMNDNDQKDPNDDTNDNAALTTTTTITTTTTPTQYYSAQTCVKSGYFRGQDYYVIKVASGGYPFLENHGNMQLYCQRTGALQCILHDQGILTEIRTAAVSALVAMYMAPSPIQCIGLLGTGVQARYQIRMVPTITSCRQLKIYGRNLIHCQTLQKELQKDGWMVSIVQDPHELLNTCDYIITTTCARDALLTVTTTNGVVVPPMKKNRGLHINCIGSDSPGKQELGIELIKAADLLIADSIQQSYERGEFQRFHEEEKQSFSTKKNQLVSLGHFLSTPSLHRQKQQHRQKQKQPETKNETIIPDGDGVHDKVDDRFTIFDSSGVALQDCIIAEMTYRALQQHR